MANDNYIYYNGEKLLLNQWQTMADYARDNNKSEGYARKLVFRTKKNEGRQRIEFKDIKELDLILVKKF